ncbi:hypothetical protein FHX15_004498 [Rhizobium sp. BK650]|uniref:hypothetical protein n=1 Tax=Rhizobium sp. BK650 TaxID=2586990 RepID=UPI0016074256|nr:hypothetical protein [Rhizobium sp. BK650]MBB3659234.1 hypothetical protein [Rhizobium sp. BK650]
MYNTFLATSNTFLTCFLLLFYGRYISDSWIFSLLSNVQTQAGMIIAIVSLFFLCIFRNLISIGILFASISLTVLGNISDARLTTLPGESIDHIRVLYAETVYAANLKNRGGIQNVVSDLNPDVAIFRIGREEQACTDQQDTIIGYNSTCREGYLVLSKLAMVIKSEEPLSPIQSFRAIRLEFGLAASVADLYLVDLSKPWFDDFQMFELYNLSKLVRKRSKNALIIGNFNANLTSANIHRFVIGNNLDVPITAPDLYDRIVNSIVGTTRFALTRGDVIWQPLHVSNIHGIRALAGELVFAKRPIAPLSP